MPPSNPLAVRSSNPVLNASTFGNRSTIAGTAGAMTIDGTVNKTALSLVILLITAAWVWTLGTAQTLEGPANLAAVAPWTMVGVVGGFIVAMVTTFKREWSPALAPAYAALEGLALGGISVVTEARYPGIVSQAVFLTFGTLGALLLAYRSGFIKVTDNLRLGIFAATGGIALVYLVGFIMSFFGTGIPMIHGSGMVGIGFSLVVVGVAAMNLVLDFDFIEQGAAAGAPKYMEWYAAFGLMVTLVWLYIEILRLLSKLQERR
ncbi:MAG TPA: Bax inhibitor-1/YccA family protein [Candidatus Limnocylindrales bacterium]|nr:Bax inhibitor-1/YccA family protein [Candidatus Limnocylindrales bacterium]